MAELCKCWKLKICYDQDYNDIGVNIATVTPLATLLAAVFLDTGNFSSKIVHGGFFLLFFLQ